MAFDPTPTTHIAGLKLVTSDGSGAAAGGSFANSTQYLCIPMSSIPEVSAVEANPATGDIRKIVFGILDAWQAAYDAMATADRPGKWIAALSSSISGDDIITRNFVNQFSTEVSGEEVADE